ncbi:MAG: TetR/AcrR family transcriptional regulator [Kangiellaceae bacterium]|jgi:AcrR family transcriptional regulator
MSNEKYHHGDLRNALIQHAYKVIEEKGVESLSLRGLAKDLGVSHGAPNRHFKSRLGLLSALATDGYTSLANATLAAADKIDSSDPIVRLNAAGKGFLRWALSNRTSFVTINHPEVINNASPELVVAMRNFQGIIRQFVAEAQQAGRLSNLPTITVAMYTNAVPFGVATILNNTVFEHKFSPEDCEQMVEDVINLVVPID